MNLNIEDWGRTRYAEAFERQLALVQQRLEGSQPDTLVFTEHEPVYTMGVRRGAEQHLTWTETYCQQRGIDVVKTTRGGDITCHAPGQVVGYPIIDLSGPRDLHAYLRALESTMIRAVAQFGLRATRREGLTGIWIEQRKLAAIGVAVRRWVSYHGFALNVCNDLELFGGIVPCGITAEQGSVTSLERELGTAPPMHEVKAALSSACREELAQLLTS